MNRLSLALASLVLEILSILAAAWWIGLAMLAILAHDEKAFETFVGNTR